MKTSAGGPGEESPGGRVSSRPAAGPASAARWRSLLGEESLAARLRRRLVQARLGSREGQRTAVVVLLALAIAVFCGSLTAYNLMPLTTFFLPLLLGSLLLRLRQFLVLVVVCLACVFVVLSVVGVTLVRTSAVVVMVVYAAIAVFEVTRRRSGLPATLGETTLIDLRDRIAQGAVLPAQPPGWSFDSEMRGADAGSFAGDFLVAVQDEDQRRIEVVMVDVSGKGVDAGTRALQLSGAFGGLLGSIEPDRFLQAANSYVLRQEWLEGFATAVHIEVDLVSGDFVVRTAGHPPALQWHSGSGRWTTHRSAGAALGLLRHPVFDEVRGHLRHGDALVTYTDGVVETRTQSFEMGIDRLIGHADRMVVSGFRSPAATLLDAAGASDDDRAVAVLRRSSAHL